MNRCAVCHNFVNRCSCGLQTTGWRKYPGLIEGPLSHCLRCQNPLIWEGVNNAKYCEKCFTYYETATGVWY